MNDETESNRLVDDILEDVAPPAFRAEMFARTLEQARRRNRARQWNRALITVAVLALVGSLFFKMPTRRDAAQPARSAGLAIVQSTPLDPSEIVASRAGSVKVIGSSSGNIAMVETSSANPGFKELDDRELLALMDGTPSVLVRQGPHQEELLVVDASTSTARPVDDTYQRVMPVE